APRFRSQKLSLVGFVDKEGPAPERRFAIGEPSQEVRCRSAEPQRQVPGAGAQKRLPGTRKRSSNRSWELRQVTPRVLIQIQVILVLLVAAKQLVGAFADLDHRRAAFTRELRN